MLLREFLEEDISNYLDGLAKMAKDDSAAEKDELEGILKKDPSQKSSESSGPGGAGDVGSEGGDSSALGEALQSGKANINININASENEKPAFVPPKEMPAVAPKIEIPQLQDAVDDAVTNAIKKSKDDLEKTKEAAKDKEEEDKTPVIQDENVFKHRPDMLDDPSSLRKIIREELGSVMTGDGLKKYKREEALKNIIHDELSSFGEPKHHEDTLPEKIHVSESLLSQRKTDDVLSVKEIMQKNPEDRTRREELSVLGVLEDTLVDLKIAVRSAEHDQAIKKYRELKRDASTLKYFPRERHFLLQQLHTISQGLFFSIREKPGVKKMIINEDTGEVMDPLDFGGEDFSQDNKAVYHVALDKGGEETFVDPNERSITVQRNIFGSKVKSVPGKGPMKTDKGRISFVKERLDDDHLPFVSDKNINVFYLLQKDGGDGARLVYRKNLGREKEYHLFSDELNYSKHSLDDIKKNIDQKIAVAHGEGSYYVQGKSGDSPWSAKETNNPEHTKDYLRALQALRSNNKSVAVDILNKLHEKYPKNIAIKVRLKDALEL